MVNEAVLAYIEGEERKKYARNHGAGALINMFHGLPWNDSDSEKVYRLCNQRGITWEEYYNIKQEKSVIY